jgi:hypothetical protein
MTCINKVAIAVMSCIHKEAGAFDHTHLNVRRSNKYVVWLQVGFKLSRLSGQFSTDQHGLEKHITLLHYNVCMLKVGDPLS